jgi:hypothetical protein
MSGSHGGEYDDDCLLGYCALTHRPDDGDSKHLCMPVNFYETTRRSIPEVKDLKF